MRRRNSVPSHRSATAIRIQTILNYALTNLVITFLIVGIEYYSGGFLDGVFYSARKVLEAPGIAILVLIQGRMKTLNATGEEVILFVSLVFYSLLIAAIQIGFYFNRSRKHG